MTQAGFPIWLPCVQYILCGASGNRRTGKLGLCDFYQQILRGRLCETQKRENFAGVKALCIGRQTAAEAEKFGFETVVSEKATIDSMVDKVRSDCND